MSVPFAVPNDECTPFPLTFERLLSHVHEMGYELDVIAEGRAAGAVFDSVPFLISIDQSGRFLSIRAMWETGLDVPRSTRPLFAAADSWNREKYFPTVYSMPSEQGTSIVFADFVLDTAAGVSKDQLTQNVSAGVSTGISAIEYMKQAAGQTLGWTDPRAK